MWTCQGSGLPPGSEGKLLRDIDILEFVLAPALCLAFDHGSLFHDTRNEDELNIKILPVYENSDDHTTDHMFRL